MKSEPLFLISVGLWFVIGVEQEVFVAENCAALHATFTVNVPSSSHVAGKADIRGDYVG